MELGVVWFVAIAILWVGYFVLEGFDFGVGMITPLIGRNDRERRVVINTIGPHFDGNEVWVITAVGAMFAAFPAWYAGLLSGMYLPLLLVLVALIVRLVAIDYRSKRREEWWRRRWDVGIVAGSAIPAVMWGVIFGAVLGGLPIGPDGVWTGPRFAWVSAYALLTGVATCALFAAHGTVFTALKTSGVVRARAIRLAGPLLGVAAVTVVAQLVWSLVLRPSTEASALAVVAVAGLVVAGVAHRRTSDGVAFAGTALTVGAVTAGWFVELFPRLLPSSLDPAWSLTIENAAATPYALSIMSIAAAVLLPVVIGYQAWSYWVFRRRLSVAAIPDDVELTAVDSRS